MYQMHEPRCACGFYLFLGEGGMHLEIAGNRLIFRKASTAGPDRQEKRVTQCT